MLHLVAPSDSGQFEAVQRRPLPFRYGPERLPVSWWLQEPHQFHLGGRLLEFKQPFIRVRIFFKSVKVYLSSRFHPPSFDPLPCRAQTDSLAVLALVLEDGDSCITKFADKWSS